MNHFIEYVCRGVVHSEDAIRQLSKRTAKLTKCCRQTNTAVFCFGVVCFGMLAILAIQDQEIKALQKQVTELANSEVETNTVDATEEQNQQKGA